MIIGFSKYFGVGGSGPVLGYLSGYLVGGEQRNPRPEVVRGDLKSVAAIIDALPFERKYSSGVLSFAPGEVVTNEVREEIMDRFESAVFAGLPPDRRSIVWVLHRDKGREEIHFVVPRVDLGTGKSLNIAPPTPSSRQLLDTLREGLNRRYGFSDPSDRDRARPVSLPAHIAKLAAQAKRLGRSGRTDIREAITSVLENRALAGAITCRADVVRSLRDQGFNIGRTGVNSITVVRPDTGERIRLKGNIYREHFRPADLQPTPSRIDPPRLLTLDRRLESLVEKRAAFHRARYGITETRTETISIREERSHDRTRNTPVPSRATMGENANGARASIYRDAFGFNPAAQQFSDAIHGVELAGQRLGQTHRTFARDFDQAVTEVGQRNRTRNLISRYSSPMPTRTQDRGMEMELEL